MWPKTWSVFRHWWSHEHSTHSSLQNYLNLETIQLQIFQLDFCRINIRTLTSHLMTFPCRTACVFRVVWRQDLLSELQFTDKYFDIYLLNLLVQLWTEFIALSGMLRRNPWSEEAKQQNHDKAIMFDIREQTLCLSSFTLSLTVDFSRLESRISRDFITLPLKSLEISSVRSMAHCCKPVL